MLNPALYFNQNSMNSKYSNFRRSNQNLVNDSLTSSQKLSKSPRMPRYNFGPSNTTSSLGRPSSTHHGFSMSHSQSTQSSIYSKSISTSAKLGGFLCLIDS